MENISNETVLQRVGEKRHLINTIREWQRRKDKRKEAKWKTSIQNTRLDEETRQWLHISEFERDGTVSHYVEKLVPKTCPWAENIKNRKILSVKPGRLSCTFWGCIHADSVVYCRGIQRHCLHSASSHTSSHIIVIVIVNLYSAQAKSL